ncbi:molybdenum cofactor biosynthesis protein MoaE [Cellulomonas sp. KH9]|uniref:molybdenum cofactor biosynthesis protein MoaE n=1 Tax=Cellulomonas sp. KH9 TaxID=1855324 RepID=UPI0008DFA1DA|nr:molybdenum cofactor biosynthesis protein MoaE [Cellulomonas sp. KH9]SFJ95021.1 molybdopterin synthase subunit MoaE [Cellulomonas sp. KH9]
MTGPEDRPYEPARRVLTARVTPDPVDVDELARAVADAAAGAVVTFAGVVRDHDQGRGVTRLEYVAHPDAQDVVERVVADVVARSRVDAVACVHRVGTLAVGECALGVAVSAAHRQDAFAAAALLVDEVKAHLPVWKRQDLTAGGHEWVGSA